MEILLCGSDELGNADYVAVMDGVYIAAASGKVLVVQDDERCLLISKK
jgi:hypothetical protein